MILYSLWAAVSSRQPLSPISSQGCSQFSYNGRVFRLTGYLNRQCIGEEIGSATCLEAPTTG